MPANRHKILKHVFGDMWRKLNRTKQLNSENNLNLDTSLNRCLTTFDITLLGVGHMVGAGIYVLTGAVAKDLAGPGIILSFILAGIASTLAALCYAEFGARVPKAGSAYVYTYLSIGEFWAFIIGWNIVLEHMIGAASVARAWSGYVDSLLDGMISNMTRATIGEFHEGFFSKNLDFVSFFICILYTIILGIGVKGSAMVNSILTGMNLGVIGLVILAGIYYGKIANWTSTASGGFLPYGFSGVLSGAATCFYAYVGFDCIATSSEEARDPAKSIPIATIVAMSVVSLIYILVSAALTLMVPYGDIHANAALPDAFTYVGLHWVSYVIVIGAICGMTTSLLGSLFSLPRCLYAMAEDGLIFGFFGRIHRTTQLPLLNMTVSTLLTALIALLFDLEKLVEFMSIGTLLAYTIVSACVIILRYKPAPITKNITIADGGKIDQQMSEVVAMTGGTLKKDRYYHYLQPIIGNCKAGYVVSMSVFVYTILCAFLAGNLHNMSTATTLNTWFSSSYIITFLLGLAMCLYLMDAHEQNGLQLRFKVPWVPYLPAASILCNIILMANLNLLTWARFAIWMALGLVLYFGYGMHYSKLNESDAGRSSSYSVLLTSSASASRRSTREWESATLHDDSLTDRTNTSSNAAATIHTNRRFSRNSGCSSPDNDDTKPIIDREQLFSRD